MKGRGRVCEEVGDRTILEIVILENIKALKNTHFSEEELAEPCGKFLNSSHGLLIPFFLSS